MARVAVIDDDAAVRDLLKYLLTTLGHEVSTYSSAVDFLANGRRDVQRIILDQQMPGMTGRELLGELRTQGIEIPTMLVSGSMTPEVVKQAQQLGISRTLAKPADPDNILDFIANAPT